MFKKFIENLNDLYYFYVVAKEKSFSKAAKTLFVSQPAVTKRIKNLESRLELSLFKREHSHIELTEIGQIIYKHLDNLINNLRQLEDEISALKNIKYAKNIRIGTTPSYSEYLMPEIIKKFSKIYPNIKITHFSDSSKQLIEMLSEKKLDIAIIALWKKLNLKDFKFYPFRKEEIVFVCNKNHPLAEHVVSFDDITKEEFIVRDASSGTRNYIEEKLKKKGIILDIKIEVKNYQLIKELLKQRNALSFLTRTTVKKELETGELKQVILPEQFFIDIGIIANKNTCPEMDKFVEILRLV